MFAHQLLAPQARAMALTQRRLKWHVAEYNRIQASWASFDEEAQKLALKAMAQHRAASMECEAILQEEEPNWGNERDITEGFLHEAWRPQGQNAQDAGQDAEDVLGGHAHDEGPYAGNA